MAQNFNENKNISKQDAINLVISNVPESEITRILTKIKIYQNKML